jgi:hypothetical protein
MPSIKINNSKEKKFELNKEKYKFVKELFFKQHLSFIKKNYNPNKGIKIKKQVIFFDKFKIKYHKKNLEIQDSNYLEYFFKESSIIDDAFKNLNYLLDFKNVKEEFYELSNIKLEHILKIKDLQFLISGLSSDALISIFNLSTQRLKDLRDCIEIDGVTNIITKINTIINENNSIIVVDEISKTRDDPNQQPIFHS